MRYRQLGFTAVVANFLHCRNLTLLASVLFLFPLVSFGQTQADDTRNQFWPALNTSFELTERIRVTSTVEKHNGEDTFYKQDKVGVIFSLRARRLRKHFLGEDVDKENEYNLTLGAGYEFLRTYQDGSTKHEHRVVFQSTPKQFFGPRILVQDRNRIEFRWIDDSYNFRYRNKLIVERAFKAGRFRFSPFASGELFWDRNRKLWNQNQYAFGMRLPYKKFFSLDTYLMHQNCSTCTSKSINILGVTGNFYFDWPGKKR